MKTKWPYLYCALAGFCDAGTGALLVLAPLWTLHLLRIPVMPVEPVYLRFVGVFVLGVGLSYLYPFCLGEGGKRDRLFAGVLHVTALVRFCVAAFVTVSVLGGALTPAWITVALTDALLAAVQVFMLARGVFTLDG